MATIPVAPFVLKDVSLTIETDNYEAHVSQVLFTPSTSTVSWKGLTPTAVFSDQTQPVWSCALSFAQDWETPDSLSNYLLENAGEEVVATFAPKRGEGLSTFTATVILTPPPIGGSVDAVAVGTVTLGVVGSPTRATLP